MLSMLRVVLLLVAVASVAASLGGGATMRADDFNIPREVVERAGADYEEFLQSLSLLGEETMAETEAGDRSWAFVGPERFIKASRKTVQLLHKITTAFANLRADMHNAALEGNKYGRYWLDTVEAARHDSEASSHDTGDFQLNRIHARANDNMYKRDPRGVDLWKTPNTFLQGGGGDCEDFALLKYDGLLRLGWNSQDMTVLVGFDGVLREYHAVLLVHYKGEYYVLDNNLGLKLDVATYFKAQKFEPSYLMNEHGAWIRLDPSRKQKKKKKKTAAKIVRRATLDKKDYGPCTNHLGTCLHMTWCEQQGHSWVSRKCPGLADAIRCCTGGVQARATSAGEAGAPELKVLRIKSTSVEAPALEEGHEAMCAFSSNEGDKMDQTSVLVMTPWSSGHKFGEGTLVLPYADGHKLFARCVARKCEAGKCGGEEEQEGDQVVVKGVVDLTEVATEEDVFSSVFHVVRLGTEDAKWTGNVQKAFADQDELQ